MRSWIQSVGLMRLLSLFLMVACGAGPDQKAVEYVPNMIYSVPYNQFSVDENGKAIMRPTPEGSIAKGHPPLHYKKNDIDAEKAGRELSNPYVATKQSLERGLKVYESYCLICHGSGGKGDGPLIPKFPNPPSFTTDRVMKLSDGRLYYAISVGVGDMASYAQQISMTDRWYLVHYIRKLQEGNQGAKP